MILGKYIITIFIILIFSNCYANVVENACPDLIVNLQNCSKYECSYFTDTKDYIKYKILGKGDNNLCRYVEQYNDNVMTCNYSQAGMQAQLGQLSNEQISSLDINALENIQAKECFFSSQENDQHSKANYELLEKTSKDYRKLKSIFFDEEMISRLDSAIGQFDKKDVDEDSLFSSDRIRLNSILYLSLNTWKIWVNGKLFQNSKNLHALRVTSDFVQFMLLQNEDVPGITFTLYPNQTLNINDLYNEK